jgi:hypothetical protein
MLDIFLYLFFLLFFCYTERVNKPKTNMGCLGLKSWFWGFWGYRSGLGVWFV